MVLVIEDLDSLRTIYSGKLRRAGYSVDTASTLDEALEMIEAKTYRVAVVDLALREVLGNEDGVAVLVRLRELSEGTRAVVLTTYDKSQLAADTIQKYGAFRFVSKGSLGDQGERALLEPVAEAMTEFERVRPDREEGIWASIRGAMPIHSWESAVIETLRPRKGFGSLKHAVTVLLREAAPLKAEKSSNVGGVGLLEGGKSWGGCFWSKGEGEAIQILFCRTGDEEVERERFFGTTMPLNPIRRVEAGDIVGLLLKGSKKRRADFV